MGSDQRQEVNNQVYYSYQKVKLLIALITLSLAAVAQSYPNGDNKPASSDVYPYNGMGRVALEKRMTDNKAQPVLKQNDFSQRNTVYIVKYDFVLGENITMPEGSILKFQGGSISGKKTITGSRTGICAGLLKIFSEDVTLGGSWNILEVYPEWFGVADDGITDDGIAISKAISMGKTVVLSNHYYVKSTITIESPIDIIGRNHGTVVYSGDSNCFVINGPRIRLSDFDILGATDASYVRNKTCGLYLGLEEGPSAREIRIDNLNIRYFDIGVLTHNTWIDTFTNVSVRRNNTGVLIEYTSNAINFISSDIDANLKTGILIDTTVMGLNIVFDNCCVEGNRNNVRDTERSKYNPLTFERCYFEEVEPYNERNIIELNGKGVVIIRDCERLSGYNCYFGPDVKTRLSNVDSRNIIENATTWTPCISDDISSYLHPIFNGDVINFGRVVADGNGNYSPLTHPWVKASKDLSDYLNANDKVRVDIDANHGVNLYRWVVVDFEIGNDVTEKELLNIQLSVGFYGDKTFSKRFMLAGITKPTNARRAAFYKNAMKNRRFQYSAFVPSIMDESALKSIGCMLLTSNVKLRILNIAFVND